MKENCPGFSCVCIRKLLADKDAEIESLKHGYKLFNEHHEKKVATLQGRVAELEGKIKQAVVLIESFMKPTDPRSVSDTVQLAKEIDADIERLDDAPWKRGFRKCAFCPDSFPVVRNSLGWGRQACNACSRRKKKPEARP